MDDAPLELLVKSFFSCPKVVELLTFVPSTAQAQLMREDKAFVSSAMLTIQAVEGRVTVTCFVHHPALYTQRLKDFVLLRGESEYVSSTSN